MHDVYVYSFDFMFNIFISGEGNDPYIFGFLRIRYKYILITYHNLPVVWTIISSYAHFKICSEQFEA